MKCSHPKNELNKLKDCYECRLCGVIIEVSETNHIHKLKLLPDRKICIKENCIYERRY